MITPAIRILHLEDDHLDADLLHQKVHQAMPTVMWHNVTTVDEFMAAVDDAPFDAVFSDSRIAGIDGLDALRVVRERRPGVPFMFVSGKSDPRWAERCLDAGAADCVGKDQLWRLPALLQRLADTQEQTRLQWLNGARAALVTIVSALSLARTVEQVVVIVRDGARRLLGADGVTFVLRDGDQCHYVDESAVGPLWKGKRFPMSSCISGWCMLNGQTAAIPDIYVDDRIPHDAYRPTFVKSLVMVPVRAQAPIGAIGSYWATTREPRDDEIELIEALANSASLALENVALVQTLEDRVRERTAELREVNRELEAFSYSVSHDLRAPLRAIDGYAELLADGAAPVLSVDQSGYLDSVRVSVRRMNRLIDDMLDLARVSRLHLDAREVPLGAIARDILNGLQAQSPQRRVVLDIDDAMTASGDPAMLRIALENLLLNAWKYTGQREEAQIAFGALVQDDGSVVYRVRDNGAGFDMAFVDQLFEPFHRLHREADFPGTGIGLAIVRRVVEKHRGRVWAEAAPGQGASFYFTLGGDVGSAPSAGQ